MENETGLQPTSVFNSLLSYFEVKDKEKLNK